MAKTKAELERVLSNPVEFIKRLKIINKSGALQALHPNDEQIEIIKALESGSEVLILKGRQIGSSTIVGAYFFWKSYVSKSPTTFAILSHKLESSKHLLKMHKIFYDNLPSFLQKPLEINNTTQMKFKGSGASILAVSAGAEGGIRSFTCSYLHISEYAFAPNPEELKATALNALNSGQLIIESTANYFNDALHQEWIKATRGEAAWKQLFFPWFTHKEYSLDNDDVHLTDFEEGLKKRFNLTAGQLLWRREKISKIGLDKFKREFPADLDDAYSQTGNVYFRQEDFGDVEIVPVEPIEWNPFIDVDKDDAYAIGVDVAAVDLLLLGPPPHVDGQRDQDDEDHPVAGQLRAGDVLDGMRQPVGQRTHQSGGRQGDQPSNRHPAGHRPAHFGARLAHAAAEDRAGGDVGGGQRHAGGTGAEDDRGRGRFGGQARKEK
jgi:hypothetical protein